MADVRTPELVINKLTKQQYESIQNPSDTELYLVPEDEEHKPICYPTTANNVGTTTMDLKSSVSDNGLKLTEVGFVYSDSNQSPTVSDTKAICDLVSGIISAHIMGLTVSTTYYIRSYGINAGGTTYGDVLTVTTSSLPLPPQHKIIEFQEPTAQNNYTWYRKYDDGWVEQGGLRRLATASLDFVYAFNLPIRMKDTFYTVSGSVTITASGTGANRNGTFTVYDKDVTRVGVGYYRGDASSKFYELDVKVEGMYATE